MAILQNYQGTFSSWTSTILLVLIFDEFILYLILMFIVSHVNLLYINVSTYLQKWLLMRFILSAVLEQIVRFLTTVHFVLGEYNNYLSNKWFDLIVFR